MAAATIAVMTPSLPLIAPLPPRAALTVSHTMAPTTATAST
jgi:hypothetical protein